jgi:hypothetical protein
LPVFKDLFFLIGDFYKSELCSRISSKQQDALRPGGDGPQGKGISRLADRRARAGPIVARDDSAARWRRAAERIRRLNP